MYVTITDDFDLDRIANSGQCFRWTKMDTSTYRIVAGAFCIYVSDLGRSCYEFSYSEEEYRDFWHGYFNLDEDYRKIRERIDPKADPFLYQASECEKGIRILRQNLWEMLVTFIISQNNNIPRIRKSVELLAECCGEKKIDIRGMEYHAFPEPAAVASLSEKDLNTCGLGYRCRYVHAAAEAVLKGNIDLEALRAADEKTSIKELMRLSGVGKKVASCAALFGLHKTDAFPIDVWVKRILKDQYPDGYPFEHYSPYNGVYQQYMFAYYRHDLQGK